MSHISGNFRLKGQCTLDNNETFQKENNLITNGGKSGLLNLMFKSNLSPFLWIAIGTGSRVTSLNSAALQNEIYRQLISTVNVSGSTVTLTTSFTAGNGIGVVSEAGIFNSLLNGTMFSRAVFPGLQKGVQQTVNVTWVFSIT